MMSWPRRATETVFENDDSGIFRMLVRYPTWTIAARCKFCCTGSGVGLGGLQIYELAGDVHAACPETTLRVRRPCKNSLIASSSKSQRPCLSLPNPNFSPSLPRQLGFRVMSVCHKNKCPCCKGMVSSKRNKGKPICVFHWEKS